DGIRDRNVTGVQTCALPISSCTTPKTSQPPTPRSAPPSTPLTCTLQEVTGIVTTAWCCNDADTSKPTKKSNKPSRFLQVTGPLRSEERRVGTDETTRWYDH